jgi:hypothetical protein
MEIKPPGKTSLPVAYDLINLEVTLFWVFSKSNY